MQTIIPYATSDKSTEMQKERTESATEQTEGHQLKSTATILDIDINIEKHIMYILGNQLIKIKDLVSKQNWRTYQYDTSTWYFYPKETSLYAEPPIRRETGVLVAAASMRAKFASRVLLKAARKYISQKRRYNEIFNEALDTFLRTTVSSFLDVALVQNAKQQQSLRKVANVPKVAGSKNEADVADGKSDDGKRSGYSTLDEEDEDEKSVEEVVVPRRKARYWQDQKQEKKSVTRQQPMQVVCSRKMIDLFIQRAARTIQRIFRGYRVRKGTFM